MNEWTLISHKLANGEITTTLETLHKIAEVIKHHLNALHEKQIDESTPYEDRCEIETAELNIAELAEDLGFVCECDDTGYAWRVVPNELYDD